MIRQGERLAPFKDGGLFIDSPMIKKTAVRGISPLVTANAGPASIDELRETHSDRLAVVRRATLEETAYTLIQLARDGLETAAGDDMALAGKIAFEANTLLQAAEQIMQTSPPEPGEVEPDSTATTEARTVASAWQEYRDELDLVRSATTAEKVEFLLQTASDYLDHSNSDGSARDRFQGRIYLELAEMLTRSPAAA